MNKKRAFRRRKTAIIKRVIKNKIQRMFQRWDNDSCHLRWSGDTPQYRHTVLRHALCNEGKKVCRRRGCARSCRCRCAWCVEGRLITQNRQKEQLDQEYAEYFRNGFYVGEDADVEAPRYRSAFGRKDRNRLYGMVDERYH